LMTQYLDGDRDGSIRLDRDKLPVVLSRDEVDYQTITEGIERCLLEIAGIVPTERRPHRVLVRIDNVDNKLLDVFVPSWNPERSVQVPIQSIDDPRIRELIAPGLRLFAQVNIGAQSASDLYFKNFELTPAADEEDGLA
jgi:hypothetical protein